MKSTTFALVAAAIPFALAMPLEKRDAERYQIDWVTDIEIVTAYAEVTEYYTGPPAVQTAYVTATAPAAPATTAAPKDEHYHGDHSGGNHWTYVAPAAPVVTEAPSAAPTEEVTTVYPSTEEPASTPESTPDVQITTPAVTVPEVSTSSASSSSAAPATDSVNGPFSIDTGSGVITAAVSAVTGAAGYASDDGAMQAALLASTNYWRGKFQAGSVVWNSTLQSMAQDTANQCLFEHTNAGQNLAAGYSGPYVANNGWAGEYKDYDFSAPDFSEKAGHFTQVVWQDTTSMGCAAVNCGSDKPAQGWYLVCNYFPVGNMLGEFGQQVKDCPTGDPAPYSP